ncbi:MAG: translation initiation factor IF-2 [Bdellovibrionales bacterium]|jgi:translation initiation factor IF-2|nr:translation initiation factor IF-2 [Bdellovibrionales bacterium]MBT3527331.1 translation initiation factor IF-2 [Bdellovibrionales bacterium]
MPKKIFELAQELGLKPLELVEELKANGFIVRNHMSVLEDADVERALELRAKKQEEEAAAKGTKKKAKAKKRVAKKSKAADSKPTKKTAKKSTKKASKEETDALAAKSGEDAPKTVKKKLIIRRKSATLKSQKDDAELNEGVTPEVVETAPGSESATISPDVDLLEGEAIEEVSSDGEESISIPLSADDSAASSAGLRVVVKPPVTESDGADVAVADESENKKVPEEGIFREPVHKFTPIYTPPKEEKKEGAATTSEDKDDRKPAVEGDTSKRKLGDLAAIMSGKARNFNRSREITEQRASSELKSLATLNTLGRPLYSSVKKKRIYSGPSGETNITEVKASKRLVRIHKACMVKDLADKLSVKFDDLSDTVLDLNLLVKPEDYVGVILAQKIADIYDYRVEDRAFNENEVIEQQPLSEEVVSKFPLRDPIITIMGHVDHGKTTLLDYIRKEKVAQGEAGGITQHIGAYSVKVGKKNLSFIDTPGHAAFASMRQRGADVTDIVVLVVAADDGVMPQTKESVRFCQNSEAPIIVAINKMDKEGVNPDRIKQELVELEITPEEWGGDTQFIPISALQGDGVDNLLEAIALQAEMMDLRADPSGRAQGVVIESNVEQGRGPVATVLVNSGTLTKGDSVVVGETYGRARSLMDHLGNQLKSAGPAVPVQVLGLNGVSRPGDLLNAVKSEREAKKVAANRLQERKELDSGTSAAESKKLSLEDFFAAHQGESDDAKDLKLLVRADVQGSYEAIKNSLESLSNREVKVSVISGGVGPITDSDVMLASSAGGFIIGFNMRPMSTARRMAEEKGVDIKNYSVIYELINDIKLAMEGLLEPDTVEKFIGRAEVRETFVVPKVGTIAGCAVTDNKILRGCNIRLLRNGKILFDGKLASLKRFKDDVKEVQSGYECGMSLENYNDVKVDDIFEAYILEETKRTLEQVEKEEREQASAAQAATEEGNSSSELST